MTEKKKIPQIRLSGFKDDWDTTKLGSITDRVIRKNTNMDSTLPLTISAQYGLVDQRTFFNSQVASQNISNYYLLMKGEFAYNKSTSQDYPVGAVKRLDRYDMGVLSTLYILFKPRTEVSSDYLVSYFDSDCWHREIILRASEGARNHGLLNISPDDFFDIDINFPPKLEEQQNIGDFLKHIDLLILQQRSKLKKLLVFKASMLEKMFPKNGADVPEVRFKGFTKAWNKRKIGECFIERNESFPGGELLSVTINNGVRKFSELERRDTSNSDKSKYKKVCIGDIAYNSMRMWQGASGYSPYEGIVSPAYTVLSPNPGINSKCIAYYFKSDEIVQTFQKNSQGITSDNWNLKFPALSKIEISVSPDIEEQEKIAAYFSHFDDLIYQSQQNLDKLQFIKKALLEKMFV